MEHKQQHVSRTAVGVEWWRFIPVCCCRFTTTPRGLIKVRRPRRQPNQQADYQINSCKFKPLKPDHRLFRRPSRNSFIHSTAWSDKYWLASASSVNVRSVRLIVVVIVEQNIYLLTRDFQKVLMFTWSTQLSLCICWSILSTINRQKKTEIIFFLRMSLEMLIFFTILYCWCSLTIFLNFFTVHVIVFLFPKM